MNAKKILLDPVLFDALHLSALAHGGVGIGTRPDRDHPPICIEDHAWEVSRDIPVMGECAYSMLVEAAPNDWWGNRNDCRLIKARVKNRVPFAKWCEIVNVDVR